VEIPEHAFEGALTHALGGLDARRSAEGIRIDVVDRVGEQQLEGDGIRIRGTSRPLDVGSVLHAFVLAIDADLPLDLRRVASRRGGPPTIRGRSGDRCEEASPPVRLGNPTCAPCFRDEELVR
jgi:hypothetical protein